MSNSLQREVLATIQWDAALAAICSMAEHGAPERFAPYDVERLEHAAREIRGKLQDKARGANIPGSFNSVPVPMQFDATKRHAFSDAGESEPE
jgi:hypothetical protein